MGRGMGIVDEGWRECGIWEAAVGEGAGGGID